MGRSWRVGIVKDSAKKMLGLHALHTACRGLPDVEMVGHVDSETDHLAEKLSATQAKRHFASLAEMLAAEPLDIVILCSRHPADHLDQIRAAASAGCHIYCEKPLAATLPEADEIVALGERYQVKIALAHPARHALPWVEFRRLVQAGAIGRPLTVYGRGKCDHRGGGEDLIVLGTHILDFHNFVFGPPSQVWAEVTQEGRPITARDRQETAEPIGPAAGDQVFAVFRHTGEVRGLFESRRGLRRKAGPVHMGVTVSGTEGTLSLRFTDTLPEDTLRLSRHTGPPEDETHYQPVLLTEHRRIPGAAPLEYALRGTRDVPQAGLFLESTRFALWDLIQAVEQDREPVASAADARRVVEMIQGIYASSLSGRVVEFPLAERAHPLAG